MNRTLVIGATTCVIAAAAYFATHGTETKTQPVPAEGDPIVAITLPDSLSPEAEIGKRAFDAICMSCHGVDATGVQGSGPPLVHKIYEPSHHADMAFQIAVQQGVRAHHWTFGNMPPQEGLTTADVGAIATYVRELQRANGIN
ncbi:c-type cytochrome [Psychromarinibacter halotolerans]|uniref:C-type cytochrome n=1 Tax=Psychromarinibacter halotolerans TaxID=1775175 RepID=A0ABV7GS29_9RHOB|nr:cytochrome c [Psychromarinibacter halotolerans]MDF0596869.1 cytochrome c [Psychromarinibacter halotolerans]